MPYDYDPIQLHILKLFPLKPEAPGGEIRAYRMQASVKRSLVTWREVRQIIQHELHWRCSGGQCSRMQGRGTLCAGSGWRGGRVLYREAYPVPSGLRCSRTCSVKVWCGLWVQVQQGSYCGGSSGLVWKLELRGCMQRSNGWR